MATVAKGGQVPPVELECPVGGCKLGEDGGGYRTPLLPPEEAIKLLTLHTQFNHVQPQGGDVGQLGGGPADQRSVAGLL